MKCLLSIAIVFSVLLGTLSAAEPEVVFEDQFKDKPGEGWTWLRENPTHWRIKEEALEIRVEPGVAPTVKNALLRKAPDFTKGTYAIDVTITSTVEPIQNFEQAGITWYHNGRPRFKLVKELVRGKIVIVPGFKPIDTATVQFRLIVSPDGFTSQFRPEGKGEFQTVAKGKLPDGGEHQVSIQCYNGPPDAEHWFRFDDFRITRLTE